MVPRCSDLQAGAASGGARHISEDKGGIMKRVAFAVFFVSAAVIAGDAVEPPRPPPDMQEEIDAEKAKAAKKEKDKKTPKKDAEPQSEEDKVKTRLKELGLTLIPDTGFAYKDVKPGRSEFGFTKITGVMASLAKDCTLACFTINLTDKDGKLLNTAKFNIANFKNGAVKSFETLIKTEDLRGVERFSIQFDVGL
jgi:hypothetical protein